MTWPDGANQSSDRNGGRMSRESFLKSAGAAGFALAGGPMLVSACGGASGSTAAAAGSPQHGGVLKIGITGSGASESLNPARGGGNPSNILRCYMLYDQIVRLSEQNTAVPGVAQDWSASPDGKTWKFKIRPGVKFHDGRPLTGADLRYSLQYMAKSGNDGAPAISSVDVSGITTPDNRTLIIPTTSPDPLLPLHLTGPSAAVIPAGFTDFTNPIGTGPFRFKSFVPGQQSNFLRNPHYWDDGKPYVDSAILTAINDQTALVNSLLSGEINAVSQLPFEQGKALASNPAVQLLKHGGNAPWVFFMRVDVPPFDDNRVRMAFKYIVDRPTMINNVLSGYGDMLNDLFGKGLTYYDSSLPQRTQELDHAKELLKSAGQSNLTVTLSTSDIAPGANASATLFAEQASHAGVKVNVKTIPPDAYYDTSLQYLKYPFGISVWSLTDIPSFYGSAFGAKAPYNETHYQNPSFDSLVNQANAATSSSQATELWAEAQKMQWDDGGYIAWANGDNLDAVASTVHGITPGRPNSLGSPLGPINAWVSS